MLIFLSKNDIIILYIINIERNNGMKHIFVINPAAGPKSSAEYIKERLAEIGASDISEIYITKGPKDATEFVRRRCTESPDEQLRFYSCGGDGTLCEVVAGIVGFDNAEMSCYPCGSGNDYVKYYGSSDVFLDLEALINSEASPVDLMKVCDRYSINVCNFGFEAVVAQTMINVKRKKLIGGKNAYTTGVVKAVFTGMRNKCTVIADGETINPNGKMLLCNTANGRFVGGGYQCAPRSLNDDGLIELCFVKPISIFKFLKLIGKYQKGTHLDDEKYFDCITYRRVKKVDVIVDGKMAVCIDGEIENSGNFSIEILPGAIKFAAPTKVVAKV